MKTSLKVIALLLAAGYPCVAFAEFFGARVAALANVDNTIGLFSVVVLSLLVLGDYSKRPRLLKLDAPSAPRRRETHRLAA